MGASTPPQPPVVDAPSMPTKAIMSPDGKTSKGGVRVPDFATASAAAIESTGSALDEQIEDLIRRLQVDLADRAPQLTIKECLNKYGGGYMYELPWITAEFADPPNVDYLVTKTLSFLSLPGGWQAALVCKAYRTCWQRRCRDEKELCVVKVGMTIDNTIDGRLQSELLDIKRWRGSPQRPRITRKSLDGNDGVGNLVALLPGASWSGSEKKLKRRLGLPLGTGIVPDPVPAGFNQMCEEHPSHNTDYKDNNNKITAWGWSMFLKKRPQGKKEKLVKTSIGPSELIIMRKEDMRQLRKNFKKNPASFASTFPGTSVDGETGSVWDLIGQIQKNLVRLQGWQGRRVKVRFNRDKLAFPELDVFPLKNDGLKKELHKRKLEYKHLKKKQEFRDLLEKAVAKEGKREGYMEEPLPELELILQEEVDELTSVAMKMGVPELKDALDAEGVDTTGLKYKEDLVKLLVTNRREAADAVAARLRMRRTLPTGAHEEQKEEENL